MPEPTIAAGYPKALLVFSVARGADRQTLLEHSGLASQDLAEPDARVPLSRYVSLFKAAIEQCADPALALHFGEAVRMQDISIVGLICEVAETTAEVGRQLNRYSRLIIDEGAQSDVVRATPDKNDIWMEVVNDAWKSNPLIVEAELVRLVCNTRATFGSVSAFSAMQFPVAAHFTHKEPPYRDEYERIFKAPLVFGSHINALLLDPAFAFLSQPPKNRSVFSVLSERADILLQDLDAAKSVRGHVESLLMRALHTGDAGMDVIARKLGFSRRTLQRKLRAEGATFENLLDELRHKLALHYLSGKKVSANETSYLLGFSEPAAFFRAFKRWTGSSPGTFRSKE